MREETNVTTGAFFISKTQNSLKEIALLGELYIFVYFKSKYQWYKT